MNRDLYWPECYNARDLGGLPTLDGKITIRRSLIRSDVLNRLTEEGKQRLIEYGVKTIVDLRYPHEFDSNPAVSFFDNKENHNPEYYNVPLGRDDPEIWETINRFEDPSSYYGFWLDSFPDAVCQIMRIILGSKPGGVVFHCHAGKDRTGMIAALLLGLAGVSRDLIIADYTYTNVRLRPFFETNPMRGHWATEKRIASMLDYIESYVGGAEEYLEFSGLGKEELTILRNRLVL